MIIILLVFVLHSSKRIFKSVVFALQVECHPYLNQSKLLNFCKERGILLTAYSPLGSPGILAKPNTPAPLKDPKIAEVAKKYGKTVAQTILRYLVSFKAKYKSTNKV